MSVSNNVRIAKNTIFLYIRMLFVMLVTLYTSRVVLQTLGESDFGLYNVVGGVVAMMSFISSAMTAGFQRYLNISLGKNDIVEYKKIFSVSIAIQIIIGLITIVVSESLGLWFLNTYMVIPEERMVAANIVYQSAVVIFLINLFISPCSAVVISYEKMSLYAIIGIVQTLSKLGIVYLLTIFRYDKLILYSFFLVGVDFFVYVCFVVSTRYLNKQLNFKPYFDKVLLKQMLGFSGWNLFGALAHLMKGNGLNILLNIFFGPTINAARGIAYQVSSGASSLYSNFQLAVRPQIMKSYAVGDINEVMRLMYMMSRFSFILMWIISLPILFTTDFIMRIWLGNAMPIYAPLFTQIILLTTVVESLASPISTVVHATGKMKKFQVICSCVILSIVPISYVVLRLGAPPESAMYVSLVVVCIVHMVRLILLKGLIKFSIKIYCVKVILPCIYIVCSSISIPCLLYFNQSNPIVLFLISFILAIFFSFLFGITRNEKYEVYNKLINIIKK